MIDFKALAAYAIPVSLMFNAAAVVHNTLSTKPDEAKIERRIEQKLRSQQRENDMSHYNNMQKASDEIFERLNLLTNDFRSALRGNTNAIDSLSKKFYGSVDGEGNTCDFVGDVDAYLSASNETIKDVGYDDIEKEIVIFTSNPSGKWTLIRGGWDIETNTPTTPLCNIANGYMHESTCSP